MGGEASETPSQQRAKDVKDLEHAPETENTPLLGGQQPKGQSASDQLYVAGVATAVIAMSTALISYNKYLMTPGVFPFAVPLVMMHALFSFIFSRILLYLCPTLFPAFTDPDKKVDVTFRYMGTCILPFAIFFAASLCLSNSAYQFGSVAFLQMMKQTNIILVYTLSLALGIESFRVRAFFILTGLLCATSATVSGQLQFSWIAFGLQGFCCLSQSLQTVVQSTLLAGKGNKLDPLSCVMLVTPVCFCMLSTVLVADNLGMFGHQRIPLPGWEDFDRVKVLLPGNLLAAFGLNVVQALFLRVGSATSFIVVNILKDAMIVFSSGVFLGESLSTQQKISFPIQLSLIALWSITTTFSEDFDKYGFVKGLLLATGCKQRKAI